MAFAPLTEPAEPSSIAHYLYEIKEKIKVFEDEWDIYKEYTNPYEYIHTQIPGTKRPVSLYKPLSRSYFKMVEILQYFDLLEPCRNRTLNSFHLAEGPGGFIEALAFIRQKQAPAFYADDRYVGMTLVDDRDKNIPAWRKSQYFLRTHANVALEYGPDMTGNLLNPANFVHVAEKYASRMDFITADGGFDFSEDFNRQETNMVPLILAQICYALCMQKPGGAFVIKIFDCFHKPTQDLIYLLTGFYEKTFMTKPNTSRMANSERYLVCLNFHDPAGAHDFKQVLYRVFMEAIHGAPPQLPFCFFGEPLPLYFMTKLNEYNAIIGQQQVDNIYYTLSLMENKANKKSKIEVMIKNNIAKSVWWCQKHGVAIMPAAAAAASGGGVVGGGGGGFSADV
jgi:23S rRNA U2552 (ribose-2'-O)-methylase RlmE/FtsJ